MQPYFAETKINHLTDTFKCTLIFYALCGIKKAYFCCVQMAQLVDTSQAVVHYERRARQWQSAVLTPSLAIFAPYVARNNVVSHGKIASSSTSCSKKAGRIPPGNERQTARSKWTVSSATFRQSQMSAHSTTKASSKTSKNWSDSSQSVASCRGRVIEGLNLQPRSTASYLKHCA